MKLADPDARFVIRLTNSCDFISLTKFLLKTINQELGSLNKSKVLNNN